MYGKLADIGLSSIRKITDLWNGAKADSLIDYTRNLRVEPIVLIDADCMYLESLPEVMQSLQSIFAGYYLQAVAVSTTVGKISVMRHLDKLNPNRNALDSATDTAAWVMTMEAYRHRLPTPGDPRIALEAAQDKDQAMYDLAVDKYNLDIDKLEHQIRKDDREYTFKILDSRDRNERDDRKMAAQAAEVTRQYELDVKRMGQDEAFKKAQQTLQKQGMELQEKSHTLNEQRRKDELQRSEFGVGRETFATLKELTNLSVGKLFAVEITDGLHKASIPVAIRLMASSIPTPNLVHILSVGNEDKSVKERYHAWKAGRLEFIKDLVFCQDLIDAHRKNLMADKDGIYANILRRNRGNQLSTLVSGNPSVATASNLVVISSDTAAQLELKVNGKLSDFKTREKLFKDTYMMIMAVIDKQWERITFYHRSIPTVTEVGVRDLKAANKGNGPDVSDILRAYQLGNSPSL